MPIETITLSKNECDQIVALEESHFLDHKATEVSPAKLTRSLSAFANSEGGELYIGISENTQTHQNTWNGFARIEDANGFIQAFEKFFPLSEDNIYTFFNSDHFPGY